MIAERGGKQQISINTLGGLYDEIYAQKINGVGWNVEAFDTFFRRNTYLFPERFDYDLWLLSTFIRNSIRHSHRRVIISSI